MEFVTAAVIRMTMCFVSLTFNAALVGLALIIDRSGVFIMGNFATQ